MKDIIIIDTPDTIPMRDLIEPNNKIIIIDANPKKATMITSNQMVLEIKNIFFDIETTEIIAEEKKGKPPVGRTQKSHNFIMSLNSKGRF